MPKKRLVESERDAFKRGPSGNALRVEPENTLERQSSRAHFFGSKIPSKSSLAMPQTLESYPWAISSRQIFDPQRYNDAARASADEGSFLIEPSISVAEHMIGRSRIASIRSEELVYKISLDFGQWGSWDIFASRTNISSLVSFIQVSRVLQKFEHIGTFGSIGSNRMGQYWQSNLTQGVINSAEKNMNEENVWSPQDLLQDNLGKSVYGNDVIRVTSESNRSYLPPGEERTKNMVSNMARILFLPATSAAKRERRLKIVTAVFQQLVSDPKIRQRRATKEFMQISNLTFHHRFGQSFKEGWVKKVFVRSRISEVEKFEWTGKVNCLCCVCACAPDTKRIKTILGQGSRSHRKMWCIVKPSFVAFYSEGPTKCKPTRADIVVTFSANFQMYKGYSTTGSHRSIVLVDDSKTITIKFSARWMKKVWAQSILKALDAAGVQANKFTKGGWKAMQDNRSFAPRRYWNDSIGSEICRAKWLIDGESYFQAVHEAILNAKEQVFIHGWWVSADLPLLRPSNVEDRYSTVCGLLGMKAREGVQICVLMYNNVSVALALNSEFQAKKLRLAAEDSGNIHVIRHPNHSDTLFWSHHEKLVVIDQRQAFCGGLDIAWGRYDTPDHRLFDPDMAELDCNFPGIDFNNVRVKDFTDVSNPNRRLHPSDCPRMPWHDIHCEHRGAIARDIARHFIQQWNHARLSSSKKSRIPELVPMDTLPIEDLVQSDDIPDGLDTAHMFNQYKSFGPKRGRWEAARNAVSKLLKFRKQKREASKESLGEFANELSRRSYINVFSSSGAADKLESKLGSESTEDTISLLVDELVNEALSMNGIDAKTPKMPIRDIKDKVKTPESPREVLEEPFSPSRRTLDSESLRFETPDMKVREISTSNSNFDWGFPVNAQVIRSRGLWSGCSPGERETSLQNAMINSIISAKRFVYIENQFFISGLDGDNRVQNRVLDAIYKRIIEAFESKKDFKVFVIMPLLPGFEGFINENPSIRRVLWYQYRCICRGENSLFNNLMRVGIDPYSYIAFFGLRTWERRGDKLATEIVYVHSKLLIVDDNVAIVGSGNINDRSLLGDRDSEVSVMLTTPPSLIPNEDEVPTGTFAHTLRMELFREHFGNDDDLCDVFRRPWLDENFGRLQDIARQNTSIYESIFPNAMPRNSVRKFSQMKRSFVAGRWVQIPFTEESETALSQTQGSIVMMPIYFLSEWEGLKPAFRQDAIGNVLGDDLFI